MDLDTAIKCLSQNYKIFKDSGTGLEPVTLSIGDRMAGMIKVNERKAGYVGYVVIFDDNGHTLHINNYQSLRKTVVQADFLSMVCCFIFRWTQTNCPPFHMSKEQISCDKCGFSNVAELSDYHTWSDVLFKVNLPSFLLNLCFLPYCINISWTLFYHKLNFN